MKILTIYLAHGDGGEHSFGPVIGYFSSKVAAEHAAHKQGWYGGNGAVTTRSAIDLEDGNVYLLAEKEPIDLDGKWAAVKEEIKEKALAKLSPEERRALGLKE